MVFHRSMVNWSRGGVKDHVIMMQRFGIVVFHRSVVNWRGGNLCGVVVFHRSIVNWRRGRGTSALAICALFYMCNIFGVVVFYISIVNWRRGWKLIQCSGVPEIYCQLEEEEGYICPRYMCILLYVQHIQCSGVPYIYGQLEEGG